MRKLALIILLASPVKAGEAEMPSEATKVRALKFGYMMNGDSMVRPLSEGSLDLVEALKLSAPRDKARKPEIRKVH
jgi:hypothetical protein